MADITVSKPNEAFLKLSCEPHISEEVSTFFTFMAPGYEFNPLFKARKWDGKIRLFKKRTNYLPAGLIRYLVEFASSRKYTIEFEPKIGLLNNFSLQEAAEYIESLNVTSGSKSIPPRDYQVDILAKSVRYKRLLVVSPTASGKSFIIYTLLRHLLNVKHMKRGLIVVPTISLVEQMYSDFADYSQANGWSVDDHCQKIYMGQSLVINKNIVISTWQSIYELDKKNFFSQFDFVIGDEAHHFKAKSLNSIMSKLVNAQYRIGTTGTLNDMEVHKLVIEGHFGPALKATTTKKLMDEGHVADLRIKCIVLKHPEEACKLLYKNKDYMAEMDFITGNTQRNKFLTNLSLSLNGNTLLLFQFVQKHGDILNEMIKKKAAKGRKVFYIFGGTDVEEREAVRKIVEKEKDAIIIASYGVFSTGVNIRNLHNIIFASPSKSKIRVLQSIGRGLRLGEDKTHATLYDISDDLRSNNYINITLKHYAERVKLYQAEAFKVSTYLVEVNHG